ncbi:SIR2 family NAD-dependent protein deacylase [Yinghuangia seranimata]|uniref:SIR2 family NAD-dependent protein deacylase n=1 Tax=Yinghuangia seranimata TaxID=408067 RepID=UPI00248AF817|nr:Sir2 family NAD-dependent protein deacetylase [Yinghuangia seranimata]MDI2129186.1 Sir2 family NAD-dependent protein deacetylase [Yinghuangia seranimata]
MPDTYQRVVALTGAGISTDSGVPDFRSPDGVWARDPGAVRSVTRKAFLTDPTARRRFWDMCADAYDHAPAPNAAHRALVDLEHAGLLRGVVTQNVDGLHQAAGSTPATVLEVHGTVATTRCVCGHRRPTPEVLALVRRAGPSRPEPACRDCGGLLVPDAVFFGDHLDRAVFGHATALARGCDLLLAVGSSLVVEPAAGLCAAAVESGADLVVVNAHPTPYDDLATAVVREPIGTALPRLAADLIAGRGVRPA